MMRHRKDEPGLRSEHRPGTPEDALHVPAGLIGTDPATDIALVKLNVTGLSVIPWGDSAQLKIGEWVLAIGSPFQLSNTVTAAISERWTLESGERRMVFLGGLALLHLRSMTMEMAHR